MLDQKTVANLLSNNLKNLFAFSMSRLYDKTEAEDLTNDIICEVLKSIHRLQNDDAFFSFMWRIADNTFKTHIRQKKLQTVEFDDAFVGAYWTTSEDELIKHEELNLLRRELSLLSKNYRETTIAYYIHGKSCSDIATELGISVEMVKYYLFKTRKILKEGFDMTREFGEKSYNPGTFRMDYWGGGDNSCYWQLFKRKLPGNIVLAAYDTQVTLQELSVELGVATVYLEEEIALLEQHDIIKKIGEKYQTNIIIFTDAYEKNVVSKIKPIFTKAAKILNEQLDEVLPQLRKLEYKGNNYNENRLNWTFANIALVYALNLADGKGRERFGDYPVLTNGSYGFVFGYDNDYANHHFNGIYGHCPNKDDTAYFSVENYRIIAKCQKWEPINWDRSVEAMCDAILEKTPDESNDMLIRLIEDGYISVTDNKLSADFPVFSQECIDEKVWNILQPLAEKICDAIIEACNVAAETLKNYVPKALIEKSAQLCFIHHEMDIMAQIIETMVQNKSLVVPDEPEKLCVFGIKR